MKIKPIFLSLIISAGLAGALCFLYIFEPYNTAVMKFYDILLHLKPEVAERQELLLIDIDDNTISEVNMYPLSRDIMADSLILLREFDAEYTVLDIEFVDRSPRGVNEDYLAEEMPGYMNETFSRIEGDTTALLEAISEGRIPPEAAADYSGYLSESISEGKDSLYNRIRRISLDFDVYLGQACGYFGKTILPVNMIDTHDPTVTEEERNLAAKHALENVSGDSPLIPTAEDIRPAILPVLRGAYALGFPRVYVDPDGVRRRIDLLYRYEDGIYPQLGLAALLDYLGNPAVKLSEDAIMLKDARFPEGTTRDTVIPLTRDGRMLINWPKETYLESFTHLSFNRLYLHDRFMKDLVHNLKIMRDNNYFAFYGGGFDPLKIYDYAEGLKRDSLEGYTPPDMDEYRKAREAFLEDVGTFLESGIGEDIAAEYGRIAADSNLPEDLRQQYAELQAWVVETLFPETRDLYDELTAYRTHLAQHLPGRFCIIGYSGTSTTDIGVTPFEAEYMNMGLYASVVNTILAEQHLRQAPAWLNILATLAAAILVGLLVGRQKAVAGLVSGITFLPVTAVILGGVFIFTGVFLDILTPLLAVFLVFTSLVSMNFIKVGKEKRFIRSAFGQYLSDEIISDLIDDPSKLHLGGQEVHMSAMFTDVQGFSTISEKITAVQLVELLNIYLTEMSDIILELGGTIDKYEGDAIIAFFGAPRQFPDHAIAACRAAVRIKKAEARLNERLLKEGRTPSPLNTRVGINTGEMVAGNMGTERKMNYTMMGNHVNLAARLEGVCKQYKIYTLISEATRKEVGDIFTLRKLDQVRVVGINTPVRLYNLIDEKEKTPADLREGIDRFHTALELFEERRWNEAAEGFRETLKLLPEDGPTGIYLKRIEEYLENPPEESWDGVYNLTEK